MTLIEPPLEFKNYVYRTTLLSSFGAGVIMSFVLFHFTKDRAAFLMPFYTAGGFASCVLAVDWTNKWKWIYRGTLKRDFEKLRGENK